MNFYNQDFLKIVEQQDVDVQDCLDSLWQEFHVYGNEITAQRQELEALKQSHSKSRDVRDLEKLKHDFEKLQTEALKSVDRFQPITDEEIKSQFNHKLGTLIPPLATLLLKKAGKPKDEEWQAALMECASPGSVYVQGPGLGIEIPRIQKAILGNAIWSIMTYSLLRRPLASYGGPLSHDMAKTFDELFPRPSKC
jgi:hypothetical protein